MKFKLNENTKKSIEKQLGKSWEELKNEPLVIDKICDLHKFDECD